MKKFIAVLLLISCWMAAPVSSSAQETTGKQKKDQADLQNEFAASYGTGTLFYFIENKNMKGNTLSGTFGLTYMRAVNPVIGVGFQVSYTQIGRTESVNYYGTAPYTNSLTDNLWQGMAFVRFRYINSPSFCMYSGIGMGVTMDYYSEIVESTSTSGQELFPAGQLTMIGIRVGRSLAFFGEFGIGTNYILNAGISYKFAD